MGYRAKGAKVMILQILDLYIFSNHRNELNVHPVSSHCAKITYLNTWTCIYGQNTYKSINTKLKLKDCRVIKTQLRIVVLYNSCQMFKILFQWDANCIKFYFDLNQPF